MLRTPRAPWPTRVAVTPVTPPVREAPGDVTVTMIGHSSFLVQSSVGNLLTDPVYSRRAGPFGLLGPVRVRAPGVAFDSLPEIAVILLSHNHYDHCDLPTLRRLARRFNPFVVTPLGNATLLRRAGLTRIEELDWWSTARHAPVPVTLTPAQHFSARTPRDRNRALWGGFVVELGDRRVFFAGDTGYASHFVTLRARLGAPDVAILPIGAYEPRWFMKSMHMNPEEAVQAHVELGARTSIASHWGTFRLAAEGIEAPVAALRESLRARGLGDDDFVVLDCGATARVAAPAR